MTGSRNCRQPAKVIDAGHVPVMNIENSYQDDTSLLRGLQKLLKDLDLEFQNENKENLVRVCA